MKKNIFRLDVSVENAGAVAHFESTEDFAANECRALSVQTTVARDQGEQVAASCIPGGGKVRDAMWRSSGATQLTSRPTTSGKYQKGRRFTPTYCITRYFALRKEKTARSPATFAWCDTRRRILISRSIAAETTESSINSEGTIFTAYFRHLDPGTCCWILFANLTVEKLPDPRMCPHTKLRTPTCTTGEVTIYGLA